MTLVDKRKLPDLRDVEIPSSTTEEVFDAGFDETFKDTFIMTYFRQSQMEEAQKEGPKFSAEEINKEFQVGVTVPTTKKAAILMQMAQEDQARNQRILEYAPDTFFGSAVGFVGKLAGGITDPIDFTVSTMLGVLTAGTVNAFRAASALKGVSATTAIATKLRKAKTIQDRAIQAVKMGRKQEFGIAVIENAAVNTVIESQAVAASEAEQIEYTVEQALINVVAGSLLMTSVFHGASAGISKLFKAGPKYTESTFNIYETAINAGKNPNEALDIVMGQISKDMEITEGISNATKLVFGEDTHLLKDSKDLGDVFGKLRDDIEDFKIEAEKIDEYFDALDKHGVDQRKRELLSEDPDVNFPERTITEIKESLLKKENNLGYSRNAAKLEEETPTVIDEKALDVQEILEVDSKVTVIRARKEEGDLGEFQSEVLEELDTFAGKEKERIDLFDEIAANCFGVK